MLSFSEYLGTIHHIEQLSHRILQNTKIFTFCPFCPSVSGLWNTGITPFFCSHSSTKTSSISSKLKLWLILKYFADVQLPFIFSVLPAKASYCSDAVYRVTLAYTALIIQPRLVFRGGRFTGLFTIVFTSEVSHDRYQCVVLLYETMRTVCNNEKPTEISGLQKDRLVFS